MLFKVKAFPAAKKERVIKKSGDSFEVYTKEKPERGLANKALLKVLSAHLKVPVKKLRFIKGARTRNKIIEVLE